MTGQRITADYLEKINAAAAVLWPFFRWDNLESMLPGGFFVGVEYMQRRPLAGAQRLIHLADGSAILEELLAEDESEYRLEYKMIDPLPLPIDHYQGLVNIVSTGSTSSNVVFACECRVHGVSADAWKALYREMQRNNMHYIREIVSRS